MKFVNVALIALVLAGCAPKAHAGSSSCTGTTSVLAGDYVATTSDCVISVDKDVFEFTYVTLPANASQGDTFTIRENTTAQECTAGEGETYCYPAGVGIVSADNSLVDGSLTLVLSNFHQQVVLVYTNGAWVATYSYF